jgi:glycosyltransferase involved in cell wall biosynthesis
VKQLSIVIPIYNEEAILEKEVERMIAEMQKTFPSLAYELLLVENGSHDQTRTIAEGLKRRHSEVRTMHLPTAGYGPALKHGLLESQGALVALFNIDFWDVQFIRKALTLQEEKNLDMVVGSKTMEGAEDTRPPLRRLITRTFNTLLRVVFGFSGTDTHGMKLLRRRNPGGVRRKKKNNIQHCKADPAYSKRLDRPFFLTPVSAIQPPAHAGPFGRCVRIFCIGIVGVPGQSRPVV